MRIVAAHQQVTAGNDIHRNTLTHIFRDPIARNGGDPLNEVADVRPAPGEYDDVTDTAASSPPCQQPITVVKRWLHAVPDDVHDEWSPESEFH